MNLTSSQHIEYTNLQMAVRRAEMQVLLFELEHDDPIAWLSMRDAVEKLEPKQRHYLKELLK